MNYSTFQNIGIPSNSKKIYLHTKCPEDVKGIEVKKNIPTLLDEPIPKSLDEPI